MFKLVLGGREIQDLGVPKAAEATSVLTSFLDGAGPFFALPAASNDLVVIATPIKGTVCLSATRTLVYSRFTLRVSEVLKAKGRTPHAEANDIRQGLPLDVAQIGGSVRFPSGHETTCLMAGRGFLEANRQYLLFLWRPVPSEALYLVSEAYLVENGSAFPIIEDAEHAAFKGGLPFDDLKARVKSAIAKNVDTN